MRGCPMDFKLNLYFYVCWDFLFVAFPDSVKNKYTVSCLYLEHYALKVATNAYIKKKCYSMKQMPPKAPYNDLDPWL